MRVKTLFKTAAALYVCGVVSMHAGIFDTDAAVKKSGVAIDAQTFPDAGFREIVKKQADTDGDGFLSKAEIQKAKKLDIMIRHQKGHTGYGASKEVLFSHQDPYPYDGKAMDFTGIETLQNLEKIRIHNSKPSNIPFQKLKKLKVFEISSAPAMAFDFSKAPGLEKIEIASMDLNGIKLEKNAALKSILIFHSNIKGKKLDFSANTNLNHISVGKTNVSKVNLGTNDQLKKLEMYTCSLKAIDLSGCRKLEYVYLSDNQLKNVDVSGNTKIRELYVEENLLKSMELDSNRELERLLIGGNPFEIIDSSTLAVADDGKLSELWADRLEKCKQIDVSHIPTLTAVYARSGNYKSVKIGKELRSLDLSSAKIKVLDASTLQALEDSKLDSLDYHSGVLEKLNTNHLENLVHLQVPDNRLKEMDISQNQKLMHPVIFDGNPVQTLTVSSDIPQTAKDRYEEFVKKNGGKVSFG